MDNKLTEYVLKHSKSKDKELKYDFMPSLLEIIECPAHKAGTVIILGVFTLMIAAVIWACLSKIDVVVTAGGSVQPSGNVNVVQAYSGGTVKSINAAEGEYVKKGDVLIELDTESLDIDTNQLNSQKEILEAQRKIYTKIKNGDDISKVKIEDYEAELKPYIQSILDADASYNNTLDSLKKDKENADLNHQISQLQLEEYEESGTIRQAEMQELIVKQNELALKQSETKIKDTKTQYSAQINSKLSEISGQLDEIETSLEKYALSKDYQYITAPVSMLIQSGKISDSQFRYSGFMILSNGEVYDISLDSLDDGFPTIDSAHENLEQLYKSIKLMLSDGDGLRYVETLNSDTVALYSLICLADNTKEEVVLGNPIDTLPYYVLACFRKDESGSVEGVHIKTTGTYKYYYDDIYRSEIKNYFMIKN